MSLGLVKVALVVGLLGVGAYDGGALVVNWFQTDEAAADAIRVAANNYATTKSRHSAEEAALGRLSELDGAGISDFALDEAGLTLTVSRTAPVVLLDHLPPVDHLVVGSVTKRADFR